MDLDWLWVFSKDILSWIWIECGVVRENKLNTENMYNMLQEVFRKGPVQFTYVNPKLKLLNADCGDVN